MSIKSGLCKQDPMVEEANGERSWIWIGELEKVTQKTQFQLAKRKKEDNMTKKLIVLIKTKPIKRVNKDLKSR